MLWVTMSDSSTRYSIRMGLTWESPLVDVEGRRDVFLRPLVRPEREETIVGARTIVKKN